MFAIELNFLILDDIFIVIREHQERREMLESPDTTVSMEPRVSQVLDMQGLRDMQVHQANPEHQDPKANLVTVVQVCKITFFFEIGHKLILIHCFDE